MVWSGLLTSIHIAYPALPKINSENLVKFRELTERDPLFYNPATNAVFLHESVTEMKKSDDAIIKIDQIFRKNGNKKYRDIFPNDWRLWPDEFLSILPRIHVATKKFINAPSPDGAAVLLDLYTEAAQSYKKAVNLNIEAFQTVLQKNPEASEKIIVFLGSGTTPEIVYNDFLLIRKNAEELEKEIAIRKNCLYYGRCYLRQETEFPVGNSVSERSVAVPFNPLPREILGIKKTEDPTDPFWVSTPCFGWSPNGEPLSHPFYITEIKSEKNDVPRKKIFMANERYYFDYMTSAEQALAYAPKNESALRYQSETNDYLCTDLRYLAQAISGNSLESLPHLIQNTLSTSWLLTYQPRLVKRPFNPLYLLINRTAYSLFFVTFSPAVWRISEEPQFLLRQNVNVRKGYLTYEDLLAHGMSKEDIIKLDSATPIQTLYRKAIKRN